MTLYGVHVYVATWLEQCGALTDRQLVNLGTARGVSRVQRAGAVTVLEHPHTRRRITAARLYIVVSAAGRQAYDSHCNNYKQLNSRSIYFSHGHILLNC